MKTLQQVLGYVPLTGLIQETTTGIPAPLPAGFFDTKGATVGNVGRYTQVTGTRKTAKIVQYGSPAQRRDLKGVAARDVKLLHTFEEIQIDLTVMQLLRNYTEPTMQNRGMDEIKRQVKEFRQLFDNLRTAAVIQAISLGNIYFDANGNLLPSSSGAAVTVDFGVPASNRNQLTDVASGTIIGASWATASTDIPTQMRVLRKTAARRTGYPLKYALYGENIPGYIAKNDYVKDWFARHPDKRAQYLDTGELPDGMMGFTWVPAFEAFYEDQGGSFRDLWSPDQVVFTPEPERSWYEVMEGTFPVPTTINLSADAVAAAGTFKDVQGMFGYGLPCTNPPGAFNGYYGDTFLPIIKVPSAIYIADVTP